jgi:sporulation protein YlmC with PRC-barrel domain
MSMRIDLHAKVRTRDGTDAGNVEGAVIDPLTNQIREVVVDDMRLDPQTGQLIGFVVRVGGALRTALGGGETTEVTRTDIDRVDEGIVHLRLTKEEVEHAASGLSR